MLIWPKKLIVIPTDDNMMEVYTCVLNHYGISPINIKDVEPEFDIENYKNTKEAAAAMEAGMAMHIAHDASIIVDVTRFDTITTSDANKQTVMTTDLLFIDDVSTVRHFRSTVPGEYSDSVECHIHKCIKKFMAQGIWCSRYDDYYIAANTSIGASIVKLMKELIDDHLLNDNEFFSQMSEYNPLSTIVDIMKHKPLARLKIELAIFRNPEFQSDDNDENEFSHVDVIIDTDIENDHYRKYVYMMEDSDYGDPSIGGLGSGLEGFADFLHNHMPIIGEVYPTNPKRFVSADYIDWSDAIDQEESGGYHVHYCQRDNENYHNYEEAVQGLFDTLAHVITDPGIMRLLAFQLKRLGISHVESETYAGKLIFSALNNSNK